MWAHENMVCLQTFHGHMVEKEWLPNNRILIMYQVSADTAAPIGLGPASSSSVASSKPKNEDHDCWQWVKWLATWIWQVEGQSVTLMKLMKRTVALTNI